VSSVLSPRLGTTETISSFLYLCRSRTKVTGFDREP
jgi:hypothetical protein